MDEMRRASRLIKGWINHAADSITNAERESAYDQLNQPTPRTAAEPEVSTTQIVFDSQRARMLLDVSETSTFDEIHAKYQDLLDKTNPELYPEGSVDRRRATNLHRLVHKAYALLTEDISVTEKRFKTLEID